MTEINSRFHLPKEEQGFKDAMKRVEGCDLIASRTSEDMEGPKIEETYTCPCGNIELIHKSIIINIDNPENGSVEIVHLRSNGCVL